jgi:hypothetical protein
VSRRSIRSTDMFPFAVQIEPAEPPLFYGGREVVARRLAVETYDRSNRGKMLTSGVLLVAHGYVIDRYENGEWASGYVEDED